MQFGIRHLYKAAPETVQGGYARICRPLEGHYCIYSNVLRLRSHRSHIQVIKPLNNFFPEANK